MTIVYLWKIEKYMIKVYMQDGIFFFHILIIKLFLGGIENDIKLFFEKK